MDAARSSLHDAIAVLIDEIAAANPERFEHIQARNILVVAGAARRQARASIRPLTFGGQPPRTESVNGRWSKPVVHLDGVRMLYEICLRPRFFLATTPRGRLETVVHELWHIAPAFDGTLDPKRRHNALSTDAFHQEVDALTQRHQARFGASDATRALALDGELRLQAWLSRPPTRIRAASRDRREYDGRDLYPAIVSQTSEPLTSSCV